MDYIVIGLLIVLTKECKRRIRGTEKRKRIGKLLGEK